MRSPPDSAGGQTPEIRAHLKKMEWINHYAWIRIDVNEEDGQSTEWMIEAAAPNVLPLRGWTKQLLPGTETVVDGFQAKDGANRANGSVITFAARKKLFVGSSGGNPGAVPGTTYKD